MCGVFHKYISCAGAEHQKKIGQQAQDFQKTFRDEVIIAARFTISLLLVLSVEFIVPHCLSLIMVSRCADEEGHR